MSERGEPLFSRSMRGIVTKNFPGGFAPRPPPHFPQSLKCLHLALDQVKVSKNTSKKIREIANAANPVRDKITVFDLKGRHFATAPPPPNEKAKPPAVQASFINDFDKRILQTFIVWIGWVISRNQKPLLLYKIYLKTNIFYLVVFF